ncbi:glutaredoxin family protein [Andreprevotia chitinilytica]|uniref:glutaredoxin family protein n=1 Tax=Andreprevotia chitinilytica TaxID=396808 RepID=UPI0005597060|nr:glutaredoxin family protein [Andreprevotia chitinilytica]
MSRIFKSVIGYALFLVIGLGGGYAATHAADWFKPGHEAGDYHAFYPNPATKVVLYGTAWCPFCAKAREYLKSKHIAYLDLDVEKQPAAKKQFDQLGGSRFPVVLIGNRKITGFNPGEFDAALGLLNESK